MIKGIIFDMVGPLLQKRSDYDPDEVVDIAEKIREKTSFLDDDMYMKVLEENPKTKKYKKEEIANKIVSKYCKIPEIWNDLLPKLKNRYKMAVINNGPAMTIPFFKKENNFDYFFDIFINSSEVHLEKPDKRIYIMALEKLKLSPEECIFIDDNSENVLGAERVGMKGIVYIDYQNLIDKLNNFNIH